VCGEQRSSKQSPMDEPPNPKCFFVVALIIVRRCYWGRGWGLRFSLDAVGLDRMAARLGRAAHVENFRWPAILMRICVPNVAHCNIAIQGHAALVADFGKECCLRKRSKSAEKRSKGLTRMVLALSMRGN